VSDGFFKDLHGDLRPGHVAADDLDAPFWAACREHRFCVHRCGVCGRAYWPASTCLDHGSAAMVWEPASGAGEVFTYTVVHHAYDRSLVAALPYVAAVVRLDEGPFFHSDIAGCEPDEVHVGLRVRVVWETLDDGTVLPHFAPDPDPAP
jgi:uncharacterized OB-fold protein